MRFFAAFAVVVFHSGLGWVIEQPAAPGALKTLLQNGYLGVTFFFVLSGFILQYVYRDALTGRGRLKEYAIARVARVYPVYILAVLAMAPFVTGFGFRDLPQFFLLQSWAPATMVEWANWNAPAWTLSVELLFYLLFPGLSRLARGAPLPALIAAVVGLHVAVLLSGSASVGSNRDVPASWMAFAPLPLLRLPEFVIGVALGELHARWRERGAGMRLPVELPVIALLITLSLTHDRYVSGAATLGASAIIFALAQGRATPLSRLLSQRWLVVLGASSYALYLLFQPVHLAVAAFGDNAALAALLGNPLAIAAGLIVFFAYEEPARRWIKRTVHSRNVRPDIQTGEKSV